MYNLTDVRPWAHPRGDRLLKDCNQLKLKFYTSNLQKSNIIREIALLWSSSLLHHSCQNVHSYVGMFTFVFKADKVPRIISRHLSLLADCRLPHEIPITLTQITTTTTLWFLSSRYPSGDPLVIFLCTLDILTTQIIIKAEYPAYITIKWYYIKLNTIK